MSVSTKPVRRSVLNWVSPFVRLGVAAVFFVSGVTAWLLHAGHSAHPLLVLAPYLPWPWLLVPAVLALWASMWLRPVWRLMSLASVLLVSGVVMDLALGLADEGDKPLRLMTYNAKVMLASQRPGGMEGLAAEIAAHDPDVLVMQDAGELRHIERSMPGLQPACSATATCTCTGSMWWPAASPCTAAMRSACLFHRNSARPTTSCGARWTDLTAASLWSMCTS